MNPNIFNVSKGTNILHYILDNCSSLKSVPDMGVVSVRQTVFIKPWLITWRVEFNSIILKNVGPLYTEACSFYITKYGYS